MSSDNQDIEPLHADERVRRTRPDQLHSQNPGAPLGRQRTVSVAADGHQDDVCRRLSIQFLCGVAGDDRGPVGMGPRVLEESLVRVVACTAIHRPRCHVANLRASFEIHFRFTA